MPDRLQGSLKMKSKWFLLTTALVLMVLGVVVYRIWKANPRSVVRQSSDLVPPLTQIDQRSMIFLA
jgi:hypothetical protein